MAIIFEKDGQKMRALDEVQASAFIKNGWTRVEESEVAESTKGRSSAKKEDTAKE